MLVVAVFLALVALGYVSDTVVLIISSFFITVLVAAVFLVFVALGYVSDIVVLIISSLPPLSQPAESAYQFWFGLSGAATSVGLLLAAYQLRDEGWDIVFRIKNKTGLILVLISTGIILEIFAAFLFFTEINIFYIFLLEMFSFFTLICTIGCYLYLSLREKDIFQNNESRFIKVLSEEISKNDPKRTSKVVELVVANFEKICERCEEEYMDSAEKFESLRSDIDRLLRGEDVQEERQARSPVMTLCNLVTDEGFVEILTTQRLDLLVQFWETLSRSKTPKLFGVNAIMHSLFFNEQSFLYKQDRNNFSYPIDPYDVYQVIFSYESIQVMDVYRSLFGCRDQDAARILEVLIHSLKVSVDSYLSERNSAVSVEGDSECISRGFDVLIKCFEWSLSQNKLDKLDNSTTLKVAEEISYFFSNTIPSVFRKHDFSKERLDGLKKSCEELRREGFYIYGDLIDLKKYLIMEKNQKDSEPDEGALRLIKGANRAGCSETKHPPYDSGSIENYLAYYLYKLFEVSNRFVRRDGGSDTLRRLLSSVRMFVDSPERYMRVIALFRLYVRNKIDEELSPHKRWFLFEGVTKSFLLSFGIGLVDGQEEGELITDILHEEDILSEQDMKEFLIDKLYTGIKEMLDSDEVISGRSAGEVAKENFLPYEIEYKDGKFYWRGKLIKNPKEE